MIEPAIRMVVAATLLSLGLLPAQNEAPSQVRSPEFNPLVTGIPGPIADGRLLQPLPKSESIPFIPLTSVTKRTHVTVSPELPELLPVEGKINVTVQLVADPDLPQPAEPLPPLPIEDPAVQARLAEARTRYRETRLLFVSARVLDFDKTVLEVYSDGAIEKRVQVVSNLDFNDFTGFGAFNVAGRDQDGTAEGRQYALILMIDNAVTERMKRMAARAGRTYEPTELPDIPGDGGPAYVVMEGDNPEALQAIDDMHSLYRVEGRRMNAARLAREKARKERKAYLLTHPPVPGDVTIQFWKRGQPAVTGNIQPQKAGR